MQFRPAAAPGEIGGVTLIGGDQVEVLDPFWLFATHKVESSSAPSGPVCAICADDPWMQNILRPIIESAGYRVVAEGEVAAPDVLIRSAEAAFDGGTGGGEIIRIRSRAEADPATTTVSIATTAALFAALGRARQERLIDGRASPDRPDRWRAGGDLLRACRCGGGDRVGGASAACRRSRPGPRSPPEPGLHRHRPDAALGLGRSTAAKPSMPWWSLRWASIRLRVECIEDAIEFEGEIGRSGPRSRPPGARGMRHGRDGVTISSF
jgi:hypothetical protein